MGWFKKDGTNGIAVAEETQNREFKIGGENGVKIKVAELDNGKITIAFHREGSTVLFPMVARLITTELKKDYRLDTTVSPHRPKEGMDFYRPTHNWVGHFKQQIIINPPEKEADAQENKYGKAPVTFDAVCGVCQELEGQITSAEILKDTHAALMPEPTPAKGAAR